MIKRLPLSIGLLLLTASAGTVRAQDAVPVSDIQSMVEEEHGYSQDIITYTTKIVAKGLPDFDGLPELSESDIEEILNNGASRSPDFCAKSKTDLTIRCLMLEQAIRDIADRERDVVALGHRMQVIATSYEEPVASFSLQPNSSNHVAFADLLKTWGIDIGAQGDAFPNTKVLDADLLSKDEANALKDKVDTVTKTLDAITPDEKKIATVWRYQYGVKTVQQVTPDKNPDGASGDKTERQYLFTRSDDLESQLLDILGVLQPLFDRQQKLEQKDPKDPKTAPNTVFVFLISLGDQNIWVYKRIKFGVVDNPAKKVFASDVGLSWVMPLDPVLPSILTEGDKEPILGGHYPPGASAFFDKQAPTNNQPPSNLLPDGGGLCYSLAGGQGYLCRARESTSPSTGCQEKAVEQTLDVQLTKCTSSGIVLSGSGICINKIKKLPPDPNANNNNGGGDFWTGDPNNDPALPCAPGSDSAFEYSIIGHACFLRECAKRSYGHKINPGRLPLVSQESDAPWDICMVSPPEEPPLSLPGDLSLPTLPEYNPAARIHELNIEYCQRVARPPMSPPALCRLTAYDTMEYPNVIAAIMGETFIRESSDIPSIEQAAAMEAAGQEAGLSIYREYLAHVSTILEKYFEASTQVLKRLASTKIPDTLCPLDQKEDSTICPASP